MKESTARAVSVYGLLILIVLTFILVIPTIEALARGVTPSVGTLTISVVILTLAFLLGLVTFPARRVALFLRGRNKATGPPVPPDLVREAIALADSAKLMWSSESGKVDSFEQNALDLLNSLASRRSSQSFAEKIPFLEQAYGYYYGWKNTHPVEEALSEEIDGLVNLGEHINDAGFFILLRHLHRFVLAGVKVANSFAQSVANTGTTNLSADQVRTWRQFAGKANRLIDDIGKLGEKSNRQFRLTETYYLPQVREL